MLGLLFVGNAGAADTSDTDLGQHDERHRRSVLSYDFDHQEDNGVSVYYRYPDAIDNGAQTDRRYDLPPDADFDNGVEQHPVE